MLDGLRRLIDFIRRREEQEEVRRMQEAPVDDHQPDGGGRVILPPAGVAAAATYRCRVCGLRSLDGDYCPSCLAPTMVLGPVRDR